MSKRKSNSDIEKECIELCKRYGHKYIAFTRTKDKDSHTRIKVVFECNKHGIKETRLFTLRKGNGCKECANEKLSESKKFSDDKIKDIFNKTYDGKYEFIDTIREKNKRGKIITYINYLCPCHGLKKIELGNINNSKCGCKECSDEEQKMTEDEIKRRGDEICNKMGYKYKGYFRDKGFIRIVYECPIHGENNASIYHLEEGKRCPKCYSSSIEASVNNLLKLNNIEFVEQKKFEWLRYHNPLRLDFYLPKYNIAIECQGKQHFNSVKTWGGNDELEDRQLRDKTKKELCENHGIKIIYYANYTYDFPYKVITDETELLKKINDGNK